MRLYAGTSDKFIQDGIHNQIADKLASAFFNCYRYKPSDAEKNSWMNSLRALSQVFQNGELLDHGILLEYQLPMTSKRLDCVICGRDSENKDNAVIIELKQWSRCEISDSENEVITWVGGSKREVLHPSIQVGQYKSYWEDTHTVFYDSANPVLLHACAYLHNYMITKNDEILSDKFKTALVRYPLYSADDVDPLTSYLKLKLDGLPFFLWVEFMDPG